MEYILLVISFVLILIGVFGSFLPVVPGPPISWLGLICLYFINGIDFNYWIAGITLFVTLTMMILDYIIPAQGTKKFGGSKFGIWGTNIGLIIGLIAPIPGGFIIGPFLGALIGELLFDSKNIKRAIKAATGSLIGFIISTFSKFLICMIFLGIFVQTVWKHWHIWF